MKSFIRNRSISFWIIALILLVAFTLFCFGFRITYAPKLENSWSAIGAAAAWFSAIASACAIVVAIQIPKKIADNQNKIALFDKRFEFYDTLTKCIYFSEMISNSSSSQKEVLMFFNATFSDSAQLQTANPVADAFPLAVKINSNLHKGVFLFDFDKDMQKELHALTAGLLNLISARDDIEKAWSKYRKAANAVDEHILPTIVKTLRPDF